MSVQPAQPQDVDDALAAVLEPGQSVVIGQGYGEPRTLIAGLARHPELIAGSEIFLGMTLDPVPPLPGARLRTFFPSGSLGHEAALREIGVTYQRQSLFELASDFASGAQAVDVVLASAAEPTPSGVSLGIAIDYVLAAASRASALVCEVSPSMPSTGPRSLAPDGPRLLMVAAGGGPHVLSRPASMRDAALADHVAPWIGDGATLQLGMGPWVAALCRRLTQRRRLRVHTGLVSDWVMDLDRAGALADAVVVGCGAGGTTDFYEWLDGNPGVGLASATLTHDPCTLAGLPDFRAVNSVLEVDLLGQANCEIGAGGRRGGVAGLPDFAGAAARADDGLSILALGSTRRGGSRIVPRLEGPAVSLTADQVDIVITEHGSADLRGKRPEDRAEAMIAVADPAYRAALRAEHRTLSSVN